MRTMRLLLSLLTTVVAVSAASTTDSIICNSQNDHHVVDNNIATSTNNKPAFVYSDDGLATSTIYPKENVDFFILEEPTGRDGTGRKDGRAVLSKKFANELLERAGYPPLPSSSDREEGQQQQQQKGIVIQTSIISSTSTIHKDAYYNEDGSKTTVPDNTPVGLITVNNNPKAFFRHGNNRVPIKENQLVQFDGSIDHNTEVEFDNVMILGPFELPTFHMVGRIITLDPTMSPTPPPTATTMSPTPPPTAVTPSPTVPPTMSPTPPPTANTMSPTPPPTAVTPSPTVPPTMSPTPPPTANTMSPTPPPTAVTPSPTVPPTMSPTPPPTAITMSPTLPPTAPTTTFSPTLPPTASPTLPPTGMSTPCEERDARECCTIDSNCYLCAGGDGILNLLRSTTTSKTSTKTTSKSKSSSSSSSSSRSDSSSSSSSSSSSRSSSSSSSSSSNDDFDFGIQFRCRPSRQGFGCTQCVLPPTPPHTIQPKRYFNGHTRQLEEQISHNSTSAEIMDFIRNKNGDPSATYKEREDLITADDCTLLKHHIDTMQGLVANTNKVDDDYMDYLDPKTLASLIGNANIKNLLNFFYDSIGGGAPVPVNNIQIRKTYMTEYDPQIMPFQVMKNSEEQYTLMVVLDNDIDRHDGGELLFVNNEGVHKSNRTIGKAIVHGSGIVHGVTSHTGYRYSLFFVGIPGSTDVFKDIEL